LRQLVWLGIGIVLMFAMLVPDYRYARALRAAVLRLVVALLVAVLIAGRIVNGSQRWLDLGPLNLQPSSFRSSR
jgi:rod shape determining protein RodA